MEKLDFQQRLVCAALPAALEAAIKDPLRGGSAPDVIAELAAELAIKVAAATFKKCEKTTSATSTAENKLRAMVHEGCRDSKPLAKCSVAHLDRMAAAACESARLILANGP